MLQDGSQTDGIEPPPRSAAAIHRLAPTAPYLAIAGAVLVLGAASLTDPFGRDQGTYAYIGYALLQGQVPYLDVFQAKPPLTSLIHALALALFGHSMTAIRLLDLLWTLATAILLYRVAAIALRHDGLALVAALAYPLMYYAFGFWDTAITDGWTNLPALAGIALFAHAFAPEGAAPRRLLDWYLAGLFIALAVLLKYTLVVLVGLLALWGLFRLWNQWSRLAAAAMASAAGFATPLLVAGLALYAAGALPAFIEIQAMMRDYAAIRVPATAWRSIIAPLGAFYLSWTYLLVIALLGGGYLVWRSLRERAGGALTPGFIVLWALAAYGSAWLQGKYFAYHLLPMLPPAAIFAAVGIDALLRPLLELARNAALRGAAIGTAALALVFATGIPGAAYDAGALAVGRLDWSRHWQGDRFNFRTFYLRDIVAVAAHLRQTTAPEDRVFVWSFEPMIYFLARRRPVSRFIYDFPLASIYGRPWFRRELMDRLAAEPPAAFVIQHREPMPLVLGHGLDSHAAWAAFTELHNFVLQDYRLAATVGTFDVYRRDPGRD